MIFTSVNPSKAVEAIKSNHRVFVHGAAATPNVLLKALVEQAERLENVEIISLHTEGKPLYADARYRNNFKVANLFVGANMRPYLDYDRVDYLPCFLSEIPQLFKSGRRPIDVALISLSPPDKHGFCTLGTSVDIVKSAVQAASIVIAQVNKQMPRVHGDGYINLKDVDFYTEVDEPIASAKPSQLSEVEVKIGQHVASLIENGSTLQLGIGSVPNAVALALKGHKNIGLHTEMWSDGALNLIKSGVIDNSKKAIHRGKSVSAFLLGSEELYKFIDDNPEVIQLEVNYVNNPAIIARNPKVVAVNSAVEVDLTGQVCADSIGHKIISGVGGQMDFMRGASISVGGKPIIALTSRSKKGIPRIVRTLASGAGVVTTRAHVHYVVTEYGVADLYGKTLKERAQALRDIAHPDDRANLDL